VVAPLLLAALVVILHSQLVEDHSLLSSLVVVVEMLLPTYQEPVDGTSLEDVLQTIHSHMEKVQQLL
jgi:hypothetical protein